MASPSADAGVGAGGVSRRRRRAGLVPRTFRLVGREDVVARGQPPPVRRPSRRTPCRSSPGLSMQTAVLSGLVRGERTATTPAHSGSAVTSMPPPPSVDRQRQALGRGEGLVPALASVGRAAHDAVLRRAPFARSASSTARSMTSLAPHGRTILSAAVCTALASPGSRDQALSGAAPALPRWCRRQRCSRAVSVHSTSSTHPEGRTVGGARRAARRSASGQVGRASRSRRRRLVTHSPPESVHEPARTTHAMRGPTAVTNCSHRGRLDVHRRCRGLGRRRPDLVGVGRYRWRGRRRRRRGHEVVRGHGSQAQPMSTASAARQHCPARRPELPCLVPSGTASQTAGPGTTASVAHSRIPDRADPDARLRRVGARRSARRPVRDAGEGGARLRRRAARHPRR